MIDDILAPKPRIDRAASLRRAMRTLVTRRGLHDASISAIANEARVAQGTAYLHYESKQQLLIAPYVELKKELGAAACAGIDPSAKPSERFIQLWLDAYRFLAPEPERAQFLLQIESSPYARSAHERAMAVADDPMMQEAATLFAANVLAPLDLEVLYDLAYWPVIRRAASGETLDEDGARAIAEACWRAITLGCVSRASWSNR